MGYKRQDTHYKLNFKDTEMEGLEVTARSLPTGRLLTLMKLAVSLSTPDEKSGHVGEDIAAVADLFDGFAKGLVSWNLEEEDGTPVPATLEGINDQEFPFVMTVIMAWLDGITGVSKSLGKGSTSGETFPEVAIPMDPL